MCCVSFVIKDKLEYPAVIFFVLDGLSPTAIRPKFVKVYSFVFKKWAVKFKRGLTSLVDDLCDRQPKFATTDEIIEIVHNMVLKVYEVATAVN